MEILGKICVVTGAASGIGRAICVDFAARGAQIICVDIDGAGATRTATDVGGHAFAVDVADEEQIKQMIETVEQDIGPIDLFCANAGIFMEGGLERPNADWQRIWDINVMSHVYAARHVLPRMMARGGGYLLITASAAGLLNQIGAAPYAVSKHAAVGLAEWLAFTHADDGIKVSVLCPQAVETAMTANGAGTAGVDGIISAKTVAEACATAIRDETFLILPHPTVLGYMRNKTANYDRWIGGMRKLKRLIAGK
ncbi:SDR family NAD(P)-dependent oxidoreductase [Yoonia sediminilitoris]|uniref:Short-subunit dehydrogenase n=1 Tax=Yoonia sediminilitoris TaxID=1286148 RepID=A0A2T6K6A1_9RHOB|nr:SDR family oxidoreductase [Yoonia sediminilitoris]PUB10156.1 short-subunit dehydrogenase [Yoonia sediminilitoris]RCW89678.1 short-subunit dehydrogenase [Yoonia sediminilitoris]